MSHRAAPRAVVVPASTANLGAGFDVLGLALGIEARMSTTPITPNARLVDRHHPASIAFRRAGGRSDLYVDAVIPIGRGLGFSGAMRAGGAALAVVSRRTGSGEYDQLTPDERSEAYTIAAELEGHGDNAAASVYGGLVAVVGDRVVQVPLGFVDRADDPAAYDPVVVVWVPDRATTSTNRSRAALPEELARPDAVFNLGRVAALLTGFTTGNPELIRLGVEDRWHTDVRLSATPETARALAVARELPTDGAWLSGSGPSVAMLCRRTHAARVGDGLPGDGHVKVVEISRRGAVVTV